MPYKDTSNITVRFVINYFSVVLQGFMMVAAFLLYNTLVTGYISPGEDGSTGGTGIADAVMTAEDGWILLMYTIILIMCLAFSGKWAKTALGVG